MNPHRDSLLAAAIVIGCWTGRALAQDSSSAVPLSVDLHDTTAREAHRQELVSAILTARETASKRPFDPALRALLAGKLRALSPEALEDFWNAGGLGDINAAAREAASPRVLGDPAADLAFTPISPCRIIDTRTAVGGRLVAGTPQSFFVRNGAGFLAQGGSANDCGVPATATSVEMNFVAVGPLGAGDLRAYAFGTPLPNASVLNYTNLPGLNIANGLAQPICNPVATACTKDVTVQADVSDTHLVVDVVGYYNQITKAQVKSFNVSAPVDAAALTGNCSNAGGAQVTILAPVAGRIVAHAVGNYALNHVTGTPSIVIAKIGSTPTDCDVSAQTLGVRLDAPMPTAALNLIPMAVSRTLAVAAGSSTTLFLNGQATSGTGHSIVRGELEATFIPD